MSDNLLGKIESARFSNEAGWLGFYFTLSGPHWGATDSRKVSNCKYSEYCKWSEEDRNKALANMSLWVNELMVKAKVDSLDRLVGKPIEATFDGLKLQSWRILEEVL